MNSEVFWGAIKSVIGTPYHWCWRKKQVLMTFRLINTVFMIWRTTLFRNMKWLYLSHLSIGQSKLNFRVDNRNAVPKFQNLCRIFFGWHLAALLQTLRYRKCETVFYNYLYNYLLIQLFIYTIIYTLVQLMTFWKWAKCQVHLRV